MDDVFELDDSEFEEVEHVGTNKVVQSPILFTIIAIRGVQKISLSFSESAIAKLDGWPRFTVKYNEKNYMLRIRASTDGPYEAFLLKSGKPSKEKRYILRIPMQPGLKFIAKLREPAPHKYGIADSHTINIQVPPAFRIQMARPGVPAVQPGEKLTPERLKALEPAPNFGRNKS